MTTLGNGPLTFEPIPGWEQLSGDVTLTEAIGVAVDSRNRVYVFNRGTPEVIVLGESGELLDTWGQGHFERPHGIWIAPDDTVYCTDDVGHAVKHFTLAGDLIRNIGPTGQASDSGADGFDHRPIRQGVGPYNLPCNVVTDSKNHIYVADGYGNARLHHFDADGELVESWGEPGSGPLEFKVPHGLGVDGQDRLYLADRENSRIQIISTDGELLSEWNDVVRPCQVFVAADQRVYVIELGNRMGLFPWMDKPADPTGSRLSIFDQSGELLCRWGGGDDPRRPDQFCAGHDIWVDSHGDIYVGEVAKTASRSSGLGEVDFPTLRKFKRVG